MAEKALVCTVDRVAQTATLAGRTLALKFKAWQVLVALLDHAPGTVTREALIQYAWNGNYLTGDKGLNQAIWELRSALADDARAPIYIRTIPRAGYRWIAPLSARPEATAIAPEDARARSAAGFGRRSSSRRAMHSHPGAALGTVCAALLLLMCSGSGDQTIAADTTNDSLVIPRPLAGAPMPIMHRSGKDIVVDLPGGCRRILRPTPDKALSSPVFSSDGEHIVFELHQPKGCQLVMVGLYDGERTDFAACPTSTSI